jgi:sec-independent protein translocase protein TatA
MGELFLIFLVVLLIFGASQIPKVAKGIGQGLREFRRAARELQDDDVPPADKPAPPKNDT